MPSSRPEACYRDILFNIDAIESYVSGMTKSALAADGMRQDAVERCLSRISEAASRLGPTAEAEAPEIPWVDVRRLGNILRHAYDHVDLDLIWEIVVTDLPALRFSCEKVIRRHESDKPGASSQ